jgi:hypothetical protein
MYREGSTAVRTGKPIQFLFSFVIKVEFISHTFSYGIFPCKRHHIHNTYMFFDFKIYPVNENDTFISLNKLWTEVTTQNYIPHYVCVRISRIHLTAGLCYLFAG